MVSSHAKTTENTDIYLTIFRLFLKDCVLLFMNLAIKVVISYIDVDGCEHNVIGQFIPPGVTTPLTLLSSVLCPLSPSSYWTEGPQVMCLRLNVWDRLYGCIWMWCDWVLTPPHRPAVLCSQHLQCSTTWSGPLSNTSLHTHNFNRCDWCALFCHSDLQVPYDKALNPHITMSFYYQTLFAEKCDTC